MKKKNIKKKINNAKLEYTPALDNSKTCTTVEGRDDTIPINIIIEIPFPKPKTVILSPSHIKTAVPPIKLEQVTKIINPELNGNESLLRVEIP